MDLFDFVDDEREGIDIEIDGLTDCLIEIATGEMFSTEYHLRTTPIPRAEHKGWNFTWSRVDPRCDVYELFLENDPVVQGRIAVIPQKDYVEGIWIESAPHNMKHNDIQGKFRGVGGHLFAIGCQASIDNGTNGFLAFTAKTNLVDHYRDMMGAKQIGNSLRMYIDEAAAQVLIEKYMKK